MLTRIRVGFLARFEHIMLGNKMARRWMQTERDERAKQQENQRFRAPEIKQCRVKAQLNQSVQKLQIGRRLFVDDHGAETVEKRLQGQPDHFGPGATEKVALQAGGNVRVQHIFTHVPR